jgi:small subunit ribosomal protein S3
MGHKVHPTGFRIGVIRDWQAKWYADKHYAEYLQEDLKLRKAIQSRYADAAVSLVEIERESNQVSIAINTARPGIVIGRGGQRVDETRRYLEELIGKKIQLNIQEIQQPELDAYLVAKAVAEQIERRVAYRRAMNQAILRTIQAGAKGMRISCAGRLGGAEIARRLNMHNGQVPLHTLRADIDYGFIEARTAMGRIGIKVWIYKGEILPEPKAEEVEEILDEPIAEVSTEAMPAVELEEQPAKPTARRRAKAAPAPEPKAEEVEKIPVEPVAEVSAKATPAVESEQKPAKPTARRRAKAAPAPEPKVAEVAETPVEPVAEVSAEATLAVESDEKPAKPTARRRTKAAPAPEPEVAGVEETLVEPLAEVSAEAELSIEQGESDATT